MKDYDGVAAHVAAVAVGDDDDDEEDADAVADGQMLVVDHSVLMMATGADDADVVGADGVGEVDVDGVDFVGVAGSDVVAEGAVADADRHHYEDL